MAGPDRNRLVLIHGVIGRTEGKERYTVGTGYFITNDLILTAGHVLSHGIPEKLEFRIEGNAYWGSADPNPEWVNLEIDAALIRVTKPLNSLELPVWGETLAVSGTHEWESIAYPGAAMERKPEGIECTTSGLSGTWYANGGRGQGIRKLELGVEFHPEFAEKWEGISGAPVFVKDKLIGIVKSVPRGFDGSRLWGIPAEQLVQDPGFQAAITPKLFEHLPSQGTWFLVLTSEGGGSKTVLDVEAAIKQYKARILEASGVTYIEMKPYRISVTEALENPGNWIQLVQAICAAPVMIVEVTAWEQEPGVMLFLGIRSVVRRGVTITVTAEEIKESNLSSLPFNIQESKLISLAPASNKSRRTAKKPEPIDQIGDAITEGLKLLKNNPDYLDLPAFEAVRCSEPERYDNQEKSEDILTPLNTILMLCSFHKEYDANWDYVFGEVQREASVKVDTSMRKPVSMIDISSPRLVGQTLYERIRWSPACLVDWTGWRPNVFFEFGVRLACSGIGPICVIDEIEISRSNILDTILKVNLLRESVPTPRLEATDAFADSSRNQKQCLFDLFQPYRYSIDENNKRPFEKAFERFNTIIEGQEVAPVPLAHDATYRTVVNWYDWEQERIGMLPHEELQASIESQLGRDPQRTGSESNILFSANSQFARQLRINVQERWIAAWYYFRSRFLPLEFSHPDLATWNDLTESRREVITNQLKGMVTTLESRRRIKMMSLIEKVSQVLANSRNPIHIRTREEIIVLQDVIDELEL